VGGRNLVTAAAYTLTGFAPRKWSNQNHRKGRGLLDPLIAMEHSAQSTSSYSGFLSALFTD
jgi:hypothetical protein